MDESHLFDKDSDLRSGLAPWDEDQGDLALQGQGLPAEVDADESAG